MTNQSFIYGTLLFTMTVLSYFLVAPTSVIYAKENQKRSSQGIISSSHKHLFSSVRVKKVRFPVRLSEGPPQTMVGFFYQNPHNTKDCKKRKSYYKFRKCIKKRLLRKDTLQVLVHGFTYNHTYWDPVGLKKPNHSYARFMANKGYSVLALDLLGTGNSSVPDGDVLNIEESVSSLVQVLSVLKTQTSPLDRPFKRVVLVGHSVGTITSVLTLGTFPGLADLLVATGWSFAPHRVPLDPALIEAALLGQNSYVRFPDNVRIELFYFPPFAKQKVIDFDNAFLADQFSRGVLREGEPLLDALEIGDLSAIRTLSRVDQVNIPVLVQLGEFDVLAPPLMPDVDKELYANSPDVTIAILKRIGHSFNLHKNRLKSWRGINRWITQRILK